MPLIQFSEKNIRLARIIPKVRTPIKSKRQVFKCSIDGYNLRIGRYKVSKIWAIKFAKWILKSFNHD
jgi:hypothetical protein